MHIESKALIDFRSLFVQDEVAGDNACGRQGRQFGAPARPAGCLITRLLFHSHFLLLFQCTHGQVYYADSTFYDWIRTCPEKRRRKAPARALKAQFRCVSGGPN